MVEFEIRGLDPASPRLLRAMLQPRRKAADMTVLVPVDAPGVPGPAAARQAGVPRTQAEKPFDRVARLAAMVVGTPLASVTITGEHPSCRICPGPPDIAGRPDAVSQLLCQQVIDSGDKLV